MYSTPVSGQDLPNNKAAPDSFPVCRLVALQPSFRLLFHALASFLFMLGSTAYLQAQPVYINGCSSNPGNGSPSAPYNTLTDAAARAGAGSALIIEAGSYPQPLTIQKSLTLSAPAGPVLIGAAFVGTQELCVPMTDTCNAWSWESLNPSKVVCSSSPPGARAKLYYPAAGPGAAPVACRGPFPLIIYAHGHRNCDPCYAGPIEDDYHQADGILGPLAAAGFIVISLDVSWIVTAGANSEGAMLLNALAFARDENARLGSLLHGSLDMGRVGLAGHSTGGGAALDAISLLQDGSCPSLGLGSIHPAALALLAPALDRSPAIFPPVLVIYGTTDAGEVGDGPFELYARANGPKHLVVLAGANHYGYTDALCCGPGYDGVCEVGGATGLEARRRQQLAAREYLVVFFSHYLRGDASTSDYLLQASGLQCSYPGNPPSCGCPRRLFDELTILNVQVSVCSCIP